MGLRQRNWARRETIRLKALLGNACAHCGITSNLQFDIIESMGDAHHRCEWSWRISFYRAQLVMKNLQLLCETCNKRKADHDDPF
jgi:5-methylcytosine-specific restriction endonuclease McrA